jgi:hypothetical protein
LLYKKTKKTSGLTPGDIRNSLKRADLRIEFPVVSLTSSEENVTITPGKPKRGKTLTIIPVKVKDLIEAGFIHPPLELEVTYKKAHLSAAVRSDGTILFDGKTYTSLSVAGGMARNSVSGLPRDGRSYYETNGWIFWKYQDSETGKLKKIDRLRQLYLKRKR